MTTPVRDKSGELMQVDNPTRYARLYTTSIPDYYGARFCRNWNKNRPQNVVHLQAGKGPYLNSYADYCSDIRLLGQNLSVIPEYNIDLLLGNINNFGGINFISNDRLPSEFENDFYSEALNFLDLNGSEPETTNGAVSFLEDRAHSDYIDLNSYINKEIKEHKLNSIKIKIKAIKKLLPYEGFYPQIRMVQLAQVFSSSYHQCFDIAGDDATFRTVLSPFYSPGIAFNSIKAGVGMPFSVIPFTKLVEAETSTGEMNRFVLMTSSYDMSSLIYSKLPWNSILKPLVGLQSINDSIVDGDPADGLDIESIFTLNGTSSNNNSYEPMANNFYSEVINFFKQDTSLTKIKSGPTSEWMFPDLKKKYTLDIVINKSKDFTTHSSYEGYGAKPYIYHAPPWHGIEESIATDSAFNSDEDLAPSASYDASRSLVRITFDPELIIPTGSNTDYLSKGIFKVGDILRYSTLEYSSSTNTSSVAVQISDIVDLFAESSDKQYWQPTINWECPTAELNYAGLSAKLTNSSGYDSGGDTIGDSIRGAWHQYASISEPRDGLFLTVSETIGDPTLTGSLLDVVGFKRRDTKKIGTIADFKNLSETMIVIPFYMDSCGIEKYFDIDIDHFERMYEKKIGIVEDLRKISKDYIFPPSLDFMRQRYLSRKRIEKDDYGIIKSPILMFPFEFTTVLDKQDLANIWQGVMPNISVTAEVEYQEKEFNIEHYLKDLDFKLPDNTRFKIFRLKQRGIVNYQQILDKTAGKDSFSYDYGYNWPYDFCSLVEMAEVKVELKYESPEE